MEFRNAHYNAAGTIDCEIDHPQFGWIPFTASPDDIEQFGREVFAAIDKSIVGPYAPPPPEDQPRSMVAKSVVQSRIIDAGKMADAKALLDANPVYFARWFAPDHPSVYCDDPDAMALVTALGLDPTVILAS
jgi:hypothetical protein